MNNIKIITSLILMILSFHVSSAEKINITFNSFIPNQHYFNQDILLPWLKEIESLTEGRVTFDVPTSSLAAPAQQYSAVINGVFDAGYMMNATNPELVKLLSLPHLPAINKSAGKSSIALWRTYNKFFRQTDELKDVKILSTIVANPAIGIYGLKGDVVSVDDVAGKRSFALPGSPAKMLNLLGSGVIAQPAVRSYEVISSGAVDFFSGYALSDALTFKTMQFIKTVTEVPGGISAPAFTIIMNKDVWNSISKEDQDIIEKHAGEEFASRLFLYDQKAQEAKEVALSNGVKFNKMNSDLEKEVSIHSDELQAEWIEGANKMGVDGKAALAYYTSIALSEN
ncbi:hypothetical protein [Amphritea sp.]|uniref:hypothetical protein n=1 Tax=Amphritea sp. TaxID=1872502 RepID=UPI003D10D6A9